MRQLTEDEIDIGLPGITEPGCSEFGCWAAWSEDSAGKHTLLAVSHSKTRMEKLLDQRAADRLAWRALPNWGNIYHPMQNVVHEWTAEIRFV